MPRYFIQLSYKGTRYNGWQVQLNTPHTIQQELQDKLGMILRESLDITGCGRTDTGVHARNYFAHFDASAQGLHLDEKYVYKFNQVLPDDIAVHRIYSVKDGANSRFDALSRTYHYYLHRRKDPFLTKSSCLVHGELDFEMMNKAAAYLCEVTDFSSFSKSNTQTRTNNCKVSEALWIQRSEHEWFFKITADRFLRNMVRAIVGTLLEIGRGKSDLDELKKIIGSKNRSDAGVSVPAQGLYLMDIIYPDHIFN